MSSNAPSLLDPPARRTRDNKPEDNNSSERPNGVGFNPVRLGRRIRERWEESSFGNSSAKSNGPGGATSEDIEKGPERRYEIEPDSDRNAGGFPARENGGFPARTEKMEEKKEVEVEVRGKGVEAEVELGFFSDSQGEGDELREREAFRPGGLKCGVTENPGWEIQAWI